MLPQVQPRTFLASESEGPPDGDTDAQTQQRYMDIFNDIFEHFGLRDTRKVLATQSTDDERDDNRFDYDKISMNTPHFSTRPDLVVLGHDPRLLPRAVDSYTRSMSAGREERRELYRGCVAIGKVQRFTRWNEMDMMLEKVATCARFAIFYAPPLRSGCYGRECFLQQPGRQFVYCFSLTPKHFQLFLFDRHGVVKSESLNINEDAVQFVQAIRLLAESNLSTMGFDPTIYWEDGIQCVDIVDGVEGIPVTVKYVIDRIISQKTTISGSGTLCWGLRTAGGGDHYVMKDIWRTDGDGREEDFLFAIEQAGLNGVTKLHLVDDSFAKGGLSIASLRRGQGLMGEVSDNRTFSRLIFEASGPSICHFKSGLQLLQALRAVIQSECCQSNMYSSTYVHFSPSTSGESWLAPQGHLSITHPTWRSRRPPSGCPD